MSPPFGGPVADTEPVLSSEHKDIGLFTESELARLTMPDGYRRSIAAWFTDIRRDA